MTVDFRIPFSAEIIQEFPHKHIMTTKRNSNSFSLLRSIRGIKKSKKEIKTEKEFNAENEANHSTVATTTTAMGMGMGTRDIADTDTASRDIAICTSSLATTPHGPRRDLHSFQISNSLVLLKLDLKTCSSIAIKGWF